MKLRKLLQLTAFVFITLPAFSQQQWKLHQEEEFLRIEIKEAVCQTEQVDNQKLLLFKLTNTSDEKRTYSWQIEIWRNNHCANCDKLDLGEYDRSVTLEPGESIEGSCLSKENKALYLFGNFIELVPGMKEQYLTGFSFESLTSIITE